jgi:DNA repair ATPase RecN
MYMAEAGDIQAVITENRRLRVELEEVTAILELREEELKLFRYQDKQVSELQSKLSNTDVELSSLRQAMEKNGRRAAAAIGMQEELLTELEEINLLRKEIQQLHVQVSQLERRVCPRNHAA